MCCPYLAPRRHAQVAPPPLHDMRIHTSGTSASAPAPCSRGACSGSEQVLDIDDEDDQKASTALGASSTVDLLDMPVLCRLFLRPAWAAQSLPSTSSVSTPLAISLDLSFQSATVRCPEPTETPPTKADCSATTCWTGASCLSTEDCFARHTRGRARDSTPRTPSNPAASASEPASACMAPESALPSSSSVLDAVDRASPSHSAKTAVFCRFGLLLRCLSKAGFGSNRPDRKCV
mmetsp:Transcript_106552/g.267071  ORF Transcript_106552/g.267071 Transcript_106552/m.267071 type:complete len:234 (-) Transcript_106552:402-1103(-)